jgi:phytanoyl-CoA hydroxylase
MSNINPSKITTFFKENGYYLAKNVYSPEEIAAMETDFDRVVEKLLGSGENVNARWGGQLMDAIDGGASTIFHTHNIQSFSAAWLKALVHDRFLDVAESILGPDIMLHHTKLFCKPPEKGSPFPMHQDWQYFPTVKDTMIAAVVHVSEATDEMGCFRVYPGSHRLARTEGMMGGGQNAEVTAKHPIEGATILEAEPGDVLFFHYFTLHGSMPNRSNRTRKTVLVQMHAGDDEVEEGNRHTNVRLVLRGFNHLATRSNVGRIR